MQIINHFVHSYIISTMTEVMIILRYRENGNALCSNDIINTKYEVVTLDVLYLYSNQCSAIDEKEAETDN